MKNFLQRLGLASIGLFFITFSVQAQAIDAQRLTDSYLKSNYNDLKLTLEDVTHYRLSSELVTKHNGLTHLYLQQTHADIPVFNAIFNINLLENGSVLSVGNRFLPQLAQRVNTTVAQIDQKTAVGHFARQMRLGTLPNLKQLPSSTETVSYFDAGGAALEPVKVEPMYFPVDEEIRLAWKVSFYAPDAQNWWVAHIDATNGDLIGLDDLVIHCSFESECPEEHAAHTHLDHASDAFTPTPPAGGAAYRVYPLTIESPNHGDRVRVTDPADATASPFGWHDTDGTQGPEFTITRGNNVHAYNDIFRQNRSLGGEPEGGDSLVFDFPLDLSTNRPYTQLDPLITNLFYWNNLTHDVWYSYGFDEASGNFQENNYGNGGNEGDYVRAEALDGSGTNNANMATNDDGSRPRMQMFLWGGTLQNALGFEASSGDEVLGQYEFVQFDFGGELPAPNQPINEQVVLASDDVDATADICQPITNGEELAGKIAMVDRGDCEFGFKAFAVQQQGAIAIVICNNAETPLFAAGGGDFGDQVTIPAVFVSKEDCDELKMSLSDLRIKIAQQEFIIPDPGPSGVSSDLDNGIIVHEYTHGISTRLTGGRFNSSCLRIEEQAGEGWSDWFGMVMTTTPDMVAERRRGVGTYAGRQPINGRGIRSFAYSRDMTINPHTYADIQTERVPHGVGSVWCVMLWDLFWNLVDEYEYDENMYNGTGGNNVAMQLVIDGMKIQPCNPTFVDARDAILAADEANYDGANQCLIWETFARRGLGVGAQPGGIESFDVPNTCLNDFVVNKKAVSEAFAGDRITYTLEIVNGKSTALSEGIVLDSIPAGTTFVEGSSSCDITEENGVLTINVGDLASGSELVCTYELQVSDEDFSILTFFEAVEGGLLSDWERTSAVGDQGWRRTIEDSYQGALAYFVANPGTRSDHFMMSQPFEVGAEDNPGLSFFHRYSTETEWDGGVIEVTVDDGATWTDVGEYMVKNGYPSNLRENPESNISGRPAFHGQSEGWIETIVDLGAFSGETIRFRFRFASDANTGSEGWYVDNITFYGNLSSITNIACAKEEEGDFCDSTTTIIFAAPTNTENIADDIDLGIFPNPADDVVHISLPESLDGEVQLSLVNTAGQVLLNQQLNDLQQQTVDIKSIPAGLYYLRLESERGIATRKLIVF